MSRLQDVRAAYAHTFDECSLIQIADHQFSVGPNDLKGANLSADQEELVRETSFAWFKPHADLKHVVVMLHGWALVMNPVTLGEQSTASGQAGLASLVSAGYDVVIPEFPANPKAVGSSKDVEWAQGVCGPTDKDTYKDPANHRKMAAYLEALFKFFGLADGTAMPIVIASSYSGYFVSAWLMGLDREDGKPRDMNFIALVLLAGATTAEGTFLINYDDKPAKQSQDALSTVDHNNFKQIIEHHADFTRPLQRSLAKTPVLYVRGSNDSLFPASAAVYLGLEPQELQMIRRSSDQDSFGDVSYAEKPLYCWEAKRKSGNAPKIMAVVKDATHALYFLDAGNTGSLQPLRDEINSFLSIETTKHALRRYLHESAPKTVPTFEPTPGPRPAPATLQATPEPMRQPTVSQQCYGGRISALEVEPAVLQRKAAVPTNHSTKLAIAACTIITILLFLFALRCLMQSDTSMHERLRSLGGLDR